MKLSFAVFVALAVTQCFLAWSVICARTPDKEMDARRTAFLEAFRKGDVATIKAFYSDDALLLSFDGKAFTGSKIISQGMSMMSKQYDLELKILRSTNSRDLSYEAGTWRHLKKGTQTEASKGMFVWVWKRSSKGDWTIDTHSVTMQGQSPGAN